MSSNALYELGRVRQYKDFCGKDDDGDGANNNDEVLDNVRELEDCIDTKYDPRDTKYSIIKTKLESSHITTISNIKEIFMAETTVSVVLIMEMVT